MKPIARKDDLVIQEVGGEILVYDLRTNKAICLNQTSALVWQNCDGKKNAIEIATDIEKKLGSNVNEDFVWFAVNQLQKENLLDEENIIVNKFEGLNRREIIKKIGLTSMAAIPVVVALAAPTAIHAQSCTAMGGSCTVGATPSTCCPGLTCSGQSGNNMGTCN
ncbi:MAG: PqqD family protein [Pyrinomonadaceae bacterium]